ncbi:Transcriptional regulatory protein CreB [compost metagenome]
MREDASIELLLTDVGLPGMSGRELADMARSYRPALPVLFMTGYAETALDRQAFLDTGMDLLIKPFQVSDLLHKVRTGLG